MPLPLLALPLLAKVGIGLSAAGGLKGILSGAKMNKEANQIKPTWDAPEVSQSIMNMQGLAQTRMNSRNPYSEANRRAALGGQANAMGAIKRTALDPSQALALAASTQGQLDQSLFNLGQQDVAFDQQNMANLMNAQNAMAGEERFVNQMNNQKYQMDMSQKNALKNAANQSIVGGLQNIGAGLISAGNMQMGNGGVFGNLFKKGN